MIIALALQCECQYLYNSLSTSTTVRVLIFPDSFSTLALLHIYARSPAYGAGPVQEPSRPGRGRRVANKGEFSNLLHPFATQDCTKKPCNPHPPKKGDFLKSTTLPFCNPQCTKKCPETYLDFPDDDFTSHH